MVYVKIKTDNIELNISSDEYNIEAEDFLQSMKSVIDMVVEAESDISYNNQTQSDWDEEEQKATFQSIMSKADLSGSDPVSKTNGIDDLVSSFLDMLKDIKPQPQKDDKPKSSDSDQINAIIEKWNGFSRQK
jgi:hypothetical protein